MAAAFSHIKGEYMLVFLNTITQLILNILGYFTLDSSIVLVAFILVFYVLGLFKDLI